MSRSRHKSHRKSSGESPPRASHSSASSESSQDFGSNAFRAKMARVQGSSEGGSVLVLTSKSFKQMVDGDMGNLNEVQSWAADHDLLGDVHVKRKYGDTGVEAWAPDDTMDQVKAAFKHDKYVQMTAE